MPNNILNYTNVDFDSLRKQVEEFLSRDPRFENIRDSSIAQTLLDVFAAMTDFNNYYIERRAEEQYFETARLRSSDIMLARNLGYVVTRPIPANTGISIVIKGPLPAGLVTGESITFNKFDTAFAGEGFPFILKNTYTYAFTSADIADGIGNSDFEKVVSQAVALSGTNSEIPLDSQGNVNSQVLLDIEVIQGSIKVHSILGTNNNQAGLLFQQYNIDDISFSNFYGEEDLAFNKITETVTLGENLTKVGIGLNQSVALSGDSLFTIRRRGLIDPTKTPTSTLIPQVSLIRTNRSEGVDLNFGDDRFSNKGASNNNDNIYIQYLSTDGAKANKSGVIGNDLTSKNTFISNENTFDLTNNISFKFFRNIKNGTDMEDAPSIKLNATEIYQSLDRVITPRDYTTYLKTQVVGTSGTKIKNAVAWGEQEEIRERKQRANFRFLNVALFSVLGTLYRFPSGGTFGFLNDNQLPDSFLELNSDFSTIVETSAGIVSADGYPEQSFFNVLVKESPRSQVARIEDFRNLPETHPILDMYDRLESRAQAKEN
jgi:hypothetical protein